MGLTIQTVGCDTWLARQLLAREVLPLDALQAALVDARTGRAQGETLAQVLVARGLIPRAELEELLAELPSPELPQGWAIGAQVDRFQIEAELGAGGMGVVYRARDVETNVRYAVKTIGRGADAELLLRFQREGEAQGRVDAHPNVVKIHAMGTSQGRTYLVQDLATGGDLAHTLRGGPLPPAEAAAIVRDLARGLAWVHAAGVLHRDLKPENVLFDERGTPKLVDFGLAQIAGLQTLTQSGAVMGSPRYMAPEQARGDPADERTDVYGLGAVLYHCLAGRPPFTAQGVMSILFHVLEKDPPALPAQVPPQLAQVCLAALAKSPDARPPSAAALAERLDDFLVDPTPAPRPTGSRLLAGVALVSLATLVAGWILEPGPRAAPVAVEPTAEPTAERSRLPTTPEEADPWQAALREFPNSAGGLTPNTVQRLLELCRPLPQSPTPSLRLDEKQLLLVQALRGSLQPDQLGGLSPQDRRRITLLLPLAHRLGLRNPLGDLKQRVVDDANGLLGGADEGQAALAIALVQAYPKEAKLHASLRQAAQKTIGNKSARRLLAREFFTLLLEVPGGREHEHGIALDHIRMLLKLSMMSANADEDKTARDHDWRRLRDQAQRYLARWPGAPKPVKAEFRAAWGVALYLLAQPGAKEELQTALREGEPFFAPAYMAIRALARREHRMARKFAVHVLLPEGKPQTHEVLDRLPLLADRCMAIVYDVFLADPKTPTELVRRILADRVRAHTSRLGGWCVRLAALHLRANDLPAAQDMLLEAAKRFMLEDRGDPKIARAKALADRAGAPGHDRAKLLRDLQAFVDDLERKRAAGASKVDP